MTLTTGEVILVVGGTLGASGGSNTNSVEVFSPNGKCNFFLTGIPKFLMGAALFLFDGRITVCGGSNVNQVKCDVSNSKILGDCIAQM